MVKRSHRRSSSPIRADIARLLDPSYLPHSSSASSSPDSYHAFVDEHGDLHDPDYRDFPILAPLSRRPAWEGSSDDDADDDSAPLARRPVSPRERRRERYNAEYKTYSRPDYSSYSLTPSHDAREKQHAQGRRRLRALSPRRSSVVYDEPEPEYDVSEPSWGYSVDDDNVETEGAKEDGASHQQEWTPTCGEQIRRQWQSVTLSIRFSLFRARRRIRNKLAT